MYGKLQASKDSILVSPVVSEQSRTEILAQMEKLDINVEALEALTITQLSDLLYRMNKIVDHSVDNVVTFKQKDLAANYNYPTLSLIDKKLLKELLTADDGDISTVALSRSLQVPLTTLQRRRKRMEELINKSNYLRYEKFGMKQVTFIVSIEGQSAASIGKAVLSLPRVSKAVQILSGNGDLQVEAILKTNKDVVELSEQIKSIKGVRSIFWIEPIEVIGEKKEMGLSLLDSV